MSALQKARSGRGRVIPFEQRQVEGTVGLTSTKTRPKPKTKRGLGYPPKSTPDEERKVWMELKREVDWLVQSSDRKLVERFCHLYASWRIARDVVRAEGPYVMTKQGVMVENPAAVRERTLGDRIDKLLPKLGMTPADAHRVVPPDDGPKDPVDALFD